MGDIFEELFHILYLKGILNDQEWERIQGLRAVVTPETIMSSYLKLVVECIDKDTKERY